MSSAHCCRSRHLARQISGVCTQIVQEFGCRIDACDQQMISCTGACDIEQMSLGVVDLLQVLGVADGLDPILRRDNLVVASHHGHSAMLRKCGSLATEQSIVLGADQNSQRPQCLDSW
jgi:hypothetical protein